MDNPGIINKDNLKAKEIKENGGKITGTFINQIKTRIAAFMEIL